MYRYILNNSIDNTSYDIIAINQDYYPILKKKKKSQKIKKKFFSIFYNFGLRKNFG